MADDTSAEVEAVGLEPDGRGAVGRPGPRRTALWAVVAVVAVVAGALVVARPGDDADPPALPISLGASTFETASAAADAMLAWIRYEAGAELPALGGDGTAYRVRPAVTADSVRRLADALGLSGDVVEHGTVRRVVDDVAGLLEVDAATGWWWFSSGHRSAGGTSSGGAGDVGVDVGCTEPEERTCATAVPRPALDAPVSDGCGPADEACGPATTDPSDVACTAIGCPEPGAGEGADACIAIYPPEPECIEPVRPEPVPLPMPEPAVPVEDLPDEAEARRIALDLLAAAGTDVRDAEVRAEAMPHAWHVSVEPVLDGTPVSAWTTSVTVGPDGAVLGAGGQMATAEAVGRYPLIDTAAAIERLEVGFGAGPAVGAAEPAVDAATRTEAATGQAGAGAAPAPPATAPCRADAPEDELIRCRGAVATPSSAACDDGSGAAAEPQPDDPCRSATTVCVAEPGTDPAGCADPAVPTTLAADLPADPSAGGEPLVVTLTRAERILTAAPATDGSTDTYLVPAYRLSSDDGHVVEVIALPDESVATPEPPDTTVGEDPPATEPGVVDPVGPVDPVVPGHQECEVLVEEDASGTTHTVQTCPGDPQPVDPQPRVSPELTITPEPGQAPTPEGAPTP